MNASSVDERWRNGALPASCMLLALTAACGDGGADGPGTESGTITGEAGSGAGTGATAGGAGDCSLDPCGGDPVGEWRATGLCYQNPFAFEAQCSEFMADVMTEAHIGFSGTLSLRNDHTFSLDTALSDGYLARIIPGLCVQILSAGTTDCADFAGDVDRCSGDPAQACTCVFGVEAQSQVRDGTWEASGDTLTLMNAGSQPFCVEGDTLTLFTRGGLLWAFARKP